MICSSIPDAHLLLSWKQKDVTMCWSHFNLQVWRRPHHQQSQLVFGHWFQVRHREGLGEGGASSEGLCRFYGGGEAVQPRPLAGAPAAGLWRTILEVRRHGGATQVLVQVEPHGQGGEALHVGAVDQLLPTDHVRLRGQNTDV